jgi:hypothetical protein
MLGASRPKNGPFGLKRSKQFAEPATALFDQQGMLPGYIPAITRVNGFYIAAAQNRIAAARGKQEA